MLTKERVTYLKSMKKLMAGLLAVMMVICMLPIGAAAAEKDFFYFAASTDSRLVAAPEKVYYTEGQSIKEALQGSGHTFKGIEEDWIEKIDDVQGNYVRSDENGGYSMDRPASEINFFCFSEKEGFLTQSRQALVKAMADYMDEEQDVQAAAKAEYDAAVSGYAAADDEAAAQLAADISAAIESYKAELNGEKYSVAFSDGEKSYSAANYQGIEITAENKYGKSFSDDDGDGVLSLVKGEYTFCVSQKYNRIEGKITISGDRTVTSVLPSGDWMKAGAEISTGSGDNFDAQKLEVSYGDHTITAQVSDTYSGGVYLYAFYDESVFDEAPGLYAYYTRTDGTIINPETNAVLSKRTWQSRASAISGLIAKGTQSAQVEYRVTDVDDNGYTRSQSYYVQFERVPTLSKIRLTDQQGTDQSATEKFSPNKYEYTYRVLNTVESITVMPTPLFSQYEVTVNGQALTDGKSTVAISGSTDITVTVSSGGYSENYTLHIVPEGGKSITFNTTSSDVNVDVFNTNGEKMYSVKERQASGYYSYRYTLVPGETYTYVATKDKYYHSKKEFTMESDSGSIVTVDVITEDWINDLTLSETQSLSALYELDSEFSTDVHAYSASVIDTKNAVWVRAGTSADGITLAAEYTCISTVQSKNGTAASLSLRAGRVTRLTDVCMSNALENKVLIIASKTDNGVTYYQDYEITLARRLSLGKLAASYSGSSLLLTPEYSAEAVEYSVTVPMGAEKLDITANIRSSIQMPYGETDNGYSVLVNGEKTDNGAATVSLTGTDETETVIIDISSSVNDNASGKITLTVNKVPPVTLNAETTPENALLVLIDKGSGNRIWPTENGGWELSKGFSYNYTLTANGYVGQSGVMEVTENDAGENIIKLSDGGVIEVKRDENGSLYADVEMALTAAPENENIDHTIESQWADFRGTSYTYDASSNTLVAGGSEYTHNGITDAKTPISSEDSTLYWATKLGEGYSSSAVGCPIIVGDDLITYSGNQLFRVDSISGEVLATGTMIGSSSFAINPPTYYDGMIFVALSSGRIQAFNAKTLESLWVYTDEKGGQPNCPLTVYNGYLYTGFWVGEESDANFVCLSITDEDPTNTAEAKIPAWTTTAKGGFYWAGAYVCDDFVLVGTDDGQSGYVTNGKINVGSKLLMLDPTDGRVLDTRDGLYADIRSNVSYDKATDAYYFTTKGGYFYRAKVGKVDGKWSITSLDELKLDNYYELESNPAMSTCTPVVYNGRAYIGISGVGQFTAYSGHNLTVIDLAGWKIAYKVHTQGYPQTSGLLTTAYEDTGYVYVYFFDNFTPGKLRVLRDRPGQTSAEYVTQEAYSNKGTTTVYETPYVLFTPSGDQAQYAICSPIVDQYGTIYFKNDSAQLMAFGNNIESIEVTKVPDKTTYAAGEKFDPTGMEVTVTYSNGMKRDVTKYVTWSDEAFEEGDDRITINFPYVMYHNVDNSDGTSTAGINTTTPYTDLAIKVEGKMEYIIGDADGNGEINSRDAVLVLRICAGQEISENVNMKAADADGNGEINSRDAVEILRICAGLE